MNLATRCVLLMLLVPVLHAADAPRDDPGRVRLVLPPVIYATPGTEANIYLDNIVLVLNRANYGFEVICDKGNLYDERWTFTPKPEDVGQYDIEVIVRDEANAIVGRGRSVIRVVPKEVKATLSLLLVGDSLTDTVYSFYPQRLIELDAADEALDLRLIGSRGLKQNPPDGPLRHEGYGGWTAEAFVVLTGPNSRKGYYKPKEVGSPFVYNDASGKPVLDFARYCQEFNSGVGPDVILIALGTNDIFSASDETIDQRIDTSLGFYDVLIKEFHRVRPETIVGIELPTPPTRSQDGFRNYNGARRQTRFQYRRNQHRMLERMIERYAGLESEKIMLVPGYVNLDPVRGFSTFNPSANANTTDKVVRVNDGVHPTPEGHHQIADTFYCWLKAISQKVK